MRTAPAPCGANRRQPAAHPGLALQRNPSLAQGQISKASGWVSILLSSFLANIKLVGVRKVDQQTDKADLRTGTLIE